MAHLGHFNIHRQDASTVNALVTDVVRDFLRRNNFMLALRSDPPHRGATDNFEVPNYHAASDVHAKRRRLTILPTAQFLASDELAATPNLKEEQYWGQDLNAHCCHFSTPHDVDCESVPARAVCPHILSSSKRYRKVDTSC